MADDFNVGTASSEINSPDFGENGKDKKSKVKSISNATQALQIAVKLNNNDQQRDIRRARVLSAFNGSAPYSDGELRNKAQSYRYNVSFGFLEGVVGRAVVPYNDLTVNISELTEIQANLPDAKLAIVQEEFGNIIQKWGRWAKFISRLNQDLVLNGYNEALWPSDYDPFPVFVAQKDGFVDDGSPNDVNDLELFVWRKPYLISELYAKISDESTAAKAGWNVDNVKQALMNAVPENIYSKGSSLSGMWTALESAIRGGSTWASIVGAKMVNTYHVFASELGGKVTHYVVLDPGTAVLDEDAKADGPELFKKEERFDAMRDFLVYFDLETGDGTWHGSKGIGQRSFNTHVAIDKLSCSTLDQAFVSGLTLLQPVDQTSQEEFTLTVVGPFAVIPPGININPFVLPAVSNTTFQVHNLLTETSERRVGDVVPNAQSAINNVPITATQAKITAGRQVLITGSNLKRYIDPISEVMSIIIRRLLKANSPNAYAKEFKKELLRKGLTEDDLKEIRGARNTGRIEDILGNTAANTQIIFGEFRGDPDVDQLDLKRRRIASVLDADAADELLINDEDQTRRIESARAQIEELNSIQGGFKIPVSPRDIHEIHLQVVLQWLGTEIQAQAQGLNPDKIPLMKQVISHGAEHLGYLEKDKTKKAIFKDMEERLKMAVDTVNDLEKDAMKLAKSAIDSAAKLAQTPEELAQVDQANQQLQLQEGK